MSAAAFVDIPDTLNRRGIVFVLSAPSGTGKSTICQSLRKSPDFSFIVSHTTRPPRPGEQNGIDYRFVSESDFLQAVEEGKFLEHALVHGLRYGTPKEDVMVQIEKGMDVLLDIDVAGAAQIRASSDPVIRESLVDLFILPPSLTELETRLRKRGTEDEDQLKIRLETARKEIPHWRDYKYTIVSESMEEDLSKLRAVIRAERYRTVRLNALQKLEKPT